LRRLVLNTQDSSVEKQVDEILTKLYLGHDELPEGIGIATPSLELAQAKQAILSLLNEAEKRAVMRFCFKQQPEIERLINEARIDELQKLITYFDNKYGTQYFEHIVIDAEREYARDRLAALQKNGEQK